MISNPITGASYFMSGLGLINTSRIRRYVLMPLLINIIIFNNNKTGQTITRKLILK